jgi:hypothetical protein
LARPQLIVGKKVRNPNEVSIGHGKPPVERPSNKVGSQRGFSLSAQNHSGVPPEGGGGNDDSEIISDGGPRIRRDGGVWIRKDRESRPLSNVEQA